MPLAPEMSTYPESQNTFLALHIVSNLLHNYDSVPFSPLN